MEAKSRLRTRRQILKGAFMGSAATGAAHGAPQSWTPGKQNVGGLLRSGHLLFVGGIGGWYPNRRPEGPGDVRQQMADALEIMKERLENAGSSMANVLKVQVALVEPEKNWEGMNEVFNRYFPEPRPVRNFVGGTLLRSLLQVDCIAYVE